MPIATLSPDIDPSLSPIPAEFLLDAEGCALFVDPETVALEHSGIGLERLNIECGSQ